MSELITVARPYARAAFSIAMDSRRLQEWSDMLEFMSVVSQDPDLQAVADNPKMTTDQVGELCVGICEDRVDEQGANFVRLLAENRRLGLLPEVRELYEQYRADEAGQIEAQVISAREPDENQLTAIGEALRKRLGMDVKLTVSIDPGLLGGAVIKAGDLVIDGSLRGKLERLSGALTR
ncbi:MAG: F0F1 ATP synthase subunit delta [Pseudomonadota bacterium]|nr:F0F1 ATP synthase subunit delta [Pseudomonadota bacterium]